MRALSLQGCIYGVSCSLLRNSFGSGELFGYLKSFFAQPSDFVTLRACADAEAFGSVFATAALHAQGIHDDLKLVAFQVVAQRRAFRRIGIVQHKVLRIDIAAMASSGFPVCRRLHPPLQAS